MPPCSSPNQILQHLGDCTLRGVQLKDLFASRFSLRFPFPRRLRRLQERRSDVLRSRKVLLDPGSEGIHEELAFLDEVVRLVVRGDEDPDHLAFAEPFLRDLDPGQGGELLRCRAVLGPCESEDPVRGELGVLVQLW